MQWMQGEYIKRQWAAVFYSRAQISHHNRKSRDRTKKSTHSVHLLLPLVISWQTDCSSIRPAIIAVRHNKLLSLLWHKAVLRATNHANYLEAKLGGVRPCNRLWEKTVYIPAFILVSVLKIKSAKWHGLFGPRGGTRDRLLSFSRC